MKATFNRRGPLAIAQYAWGLEYEVIAAVQPQALEGGTVVVTILGPLSHYADWCGDSYNDIKDRVAAALATSADTVVLRINSPGGEVNGLVECARAIRRMASEAGKRLIAYVDENALSAAYGLACAADAIYLPPSGRCGSIGTIEMVVDATAADQQSGLKFGVISSGLRKSDGNPHVPFSEDARAHMQAEVDGFARLFFELVAEHRKLSVDAIAAQQAAIFRGQDAVTAGLADGVMSWHELLATVAGGSVKASAAAASGTTTNEDTMTRAQMIAALTAIVAADAPPAEPENDEEKPMTPAEARAMLTAMGEEVPEPAPAAPAAPAAAEEPVVAPPKEPAPAAAQEPASPAPAPSEDEPAASAIATVTALEARVQKMEAEDRARKEAEERGTLIAAHAMSAETRKWLSDAATPLSDVRAACKALPRAESHSPAAAAQVSGTRGATHGETSVNPELDRRMGLAQAKAEVRLDGTAMVFPVLTPEQARARVAELEKKGAAR